jgi:ATP synthase I subunit
MPSDTGSMSNPDQQNSVDNATAGASEAFYVGGLIRIRNFMLALAPILAIATAFKFGMHPALGFLLGCVISYLNFHWMKSGVSGLADKVTNTGKSQSGKGIVARFLLRYALLGGAAYAILTSFPASLRGLFAGLFLPVGAIVCEAVYELYAGIRRGI